jgi:hypothetical protein
MRRALLLRVAVALVVAAMFLASALPVFAAPPPTTPGQFTCVKFDPFTGQETVVNNVPRGQLLIYTNAGYFCFRGQ